VTPKLMINLGLRYAYVSPIKDDNGLVGSFDPNSKYGMVQQSQLGGTLWKPDYWDFSPRVGFAYDVSGKGTTVVRGGFNKIYSIFTPAQFMQSPFQNFKNGTIAAVPTGACQTVVVPPAQCPQTFGGAINPRHGQHPKICPQLECPAGSSGVFPAGATIACTATSQCDLTVVNPNLKTPYMLSWNLGVQHAFGNNLSLEVGYVGTHGDNLTGFIDVNQIDPRHRPPSVRRQVPLPAVYHPDNQRCPFRLPQPAVHPDQTAFARAFLHHRLHLRSRPG